MECPEQMEQSRWRSTWSQSLTTEEHKNRKSESEPRRMTSIDTKVNLNRTEEETPIYQGRILRTKDEESGEGLEQQSSHRMWKKGTAEKSSGILIHGR